MAKIKISTVVDSSNEPCDLYACDSLIDCPALPLFLQTYAEIISKQWSNPTLSWSNKSRMIWAEKNGTVVGGICWDWLVEYRMAWIVLSFTDPAQRGRGINSIVHSVFEVEARKLGAVRISSLVHVDNISRQKSAEKVGLKPQFYRMNKSLV